MKPLLPICSIPKAVTREGHTGAHAILLLPFYGYWSVQGGKLSFPEGTGAQSTETTLQGTVFPNNTFRKGCCSCDKGE